MHRIWTLTVEKFHAKYFEILLTLRRNTNASIISVKFVTSLKMYREVARYLLRACIWEEINRCTVILFRLL